ncbi:MAG: Stp1/IreP family PP2C-type Ser/Thr phosphatase [Elusimicrobia bacterium]|nr:Stp1/IreP family PP2C-type Ser/Thr phosphatase [Elusimicrobiota bacterium]
MILTAAGKSDTGRVRSNNEDSILINEELRLFAVADGMGGHNSGEVASRIAIRVLQEALQQMFSSRSMPEEVNTNFSLQTNQLAWAVRLANQAVFEASRDKPQNQGMGTTLSVALVQNNKAGVVHIGDSRIYMFREGNLIQLTRDHSLVMEQVRQGLITQEEAESSRLQNILTRALGTQPKAQIDVEEHPLMEGDILLLCSDGLTRMLKESALVKIFREKEELSAICNTLIESANQAGGMDNISVIVIQIKPLGPSRLLKRFFTYLRKE